MQRFFAVSQDTSGNAIPAVTVTVNLAGTATLATLYSDNSYTPLANPLTSNTDGTYQFFARNGRYDVVLAKTGFTFTASETTGVTLFDPSTSISPAQITGNQNDYTPTNGLDAAIWRLTSDAVRTITGIGAGYAGQIITLENVGSFGIVLSDQSGSSSAANQIITGTGTALRLVASGVATLVYDGTTAKWRAVNHNRVASVSRVLAQTGAALTVSNSSGVNTILSTTLPAGTLGANGAIHAMMSGTVSNTTGGNVSFTYTLLFGGSAATIPVDVVATGTVAAAVQFRAFVASANSSTAQTGAEGVVLRNATSPVISRSAGLAKNTDTDLAVLLRLQMDTASGNAAFTIDYAQISIEVA